MFETFFAVFIVIPFVAGGFMINPIMGVIFLVVAILLLCVAEADRRGLLPVMTERDWSMYEEG